MAIKKCRWCGNEDEEKNMKYWHTGSLICKKCFDDASDRDDKMMQELLMELRGGQEKLENAGWW